MRVITSTLQFAKEYPEAFNALPEPYQADDCLQYLIGDKTIACQPKPDQELALGRFVYRYSAGKKIWEKVW